MRYLDRSRLEAFRQLRKSIRNSRQYLVVGIDVAKEKHHAFLGTTTGKSIHRKVLFDNSLEGFTKLLTHVEAAKVQHGLKTVVIGLEPTADYHKPLAEFLIRRGEHVVLVSTHSVSKNRQLMDGRWDKNDGKDAANIADLLVQGKFQYYDLPAMEVRDLRVLLSLKRKLKKYEHSLRMRIRNHLVAQYFPELDKICHWQGDEGFAIVRSFLNPSLIARMEYDGLRRVVPGRGRTAGQANRLVRLFHAAPESVGCEIGEGAEFEAGLLVDSLARVREEMKRTDERIEETCRQFEGYDFVRSIPGFGPTLSAMVLAAIGEPGRFANYGQVLKLAGLDLSASRSGKRSDAVTPVISKKGKAELRYALYQAALVATSKSEVFMRWFTAKLRGREREKGIKTKMRVKLSAKMLVIAWTLMKRREYFDPEKLVL
jgi:transposase